MKKDKEQKQKTDAEIIGDAMLQIQLMSDEYYYRDKYFDCQLDLKLHSKWYNRW